MSWQLLVGLGVLLYSINGLLHRTIMKYDKSDAYAQAFVFTGLASLFFFIAMLFRGGFVSSPSLCQLLLFVLTAFLSSIGIGFYFMGFKSIGASEHTIILTSSRLWLMLGAILLLQESLTIAKLTGTVAILFGVVLAEWRGRTFVFNKGAVYVLLAAFFLASSETVSFYIVRNFDVLSYMFYSSVLVTSMLLIFRPKVVKKLPFYLKPRRALNICTTSINAALANVLGFTAYQVGRNALQISPIMATQTILTVLLAIIILKERDHMVQKILGSLAAVIGTILLL
jgi:drug/metabolite transporter (DMT)-like permease